VSHRRINGIQAIVFSIGLLQCHSAALAETRTGSVPSSRPPAIALDPVTQVPPAVAGANSQQQTISLVEPPSRVTALACVQRFFSALVQEDLRLLQTAFTSDAIQIGNARRQNSGALSYWKRRLERLDYRDLSVHLIYAPQDVSVLTQEQAAHRNLSNDEHLAVRPGELLVSVPISPNLKAPPRFGALIEFALTPVTGEYKIRALREDFEIP
jgi:hypothetical protein